MSGRKRAKEQPLNHFTAAAAAVTTASVVPFYTCCAVKFNRLNQLYGDAVRVKSDLFQFRTTVSKKCARAPSRLLCGVPFCANESNMSMSNSQLHSIHSPSYQSVSVNPISYFFVLF